MKKIKISVLVAIYIVGLVVFLPAKVALQWVHLPVGINLEGVQGTVWQGQVQQVKVSGLQAEQTTPYQLAHLKWRVIPRLLLKGQLGLELQLAPHAANPISGRSKIVWGLGQTFALQEANLQGELSKLAAWLAWPDLIPMTGELWIRQFNWVAGQPFCQQLAATVEVGPLRVALGQQWHDLNHIQAQLSCESGQGVLTVVPENHLGLTGQLVFSTQRLNSELWMQPTRQTPEAIQEVLKLLGKPDAQGRYPLRFQFD